MANSSLTTPWLDDLNPDQTKAVRHEVPPTRRCRERKRQNKTLAGQVAQLITNGIEPGRILLLTFTRRASQEMLKLADGHIAETGPSTTKSWGGPFHAIGNRLLCIYPKPAGLANDFTLMDQSDT